MVRRPKRDSKKTSKSPLLPSQKVKETFKSLGLTLLIWMLVIANLIIIVSFVLQTLNSTAGEKISNRTEIDEPVEIRQNKIQIEVLNGCGINNVANEVRQFLLNYKDIDVVDCKNYERFDIEETIVVDRKYLDERYARKVARVIGVKSRRVFPQLSEDKKLDVTVILGKDYLNLKPFQKNANNL